MWRPLAARPGFHRADLAVLLFCVTVIGAMAGPALNQVQEASNRMRCSNNLKMLGIAAHNYHSDFSRLPPGYLGPLDAGNGKAPPLDKPEETSNFGCLVFLLPYLEQDNIFRNLKDTRTTDDRSIELNVTAQTPAWWRREENLKTAQIDVKIFHCPSDKWDDKPTQGILAAFHSADGKMQQHILPGSAAKVLGRSNYAGVSGMWGRSEHPLAMQFEGILFNRSRVTLAQVSVQDGLSNTLMFGEGLGGTAQTPRDTAWSWMGVGAMVTVSGLTKEPIDQAAFRFSSRHEKGVLFGYGDGSVRLIRFGKTADVPATLPKSAQELPVNDWLLFQQLAGRKDGLNHDVSSLVD